MCLCYNFYGVFFFLLFSVLFEIVEYTIHTYDIKLEIWDNTLEKGKNSTMCLYVILIKRTPKKLLYFLDDILWKNKMGNINILYTLYFYFILYIILSVKAPQAFEVTLNECFVNKYNNQFTIFLLCLFIQIGHIVSKIKYLKNYSFYS